jgi:hypothetical protein
MSWGFWNTDTKEIIMGGIRSNPKIRSVQTNGMDKDIQPIARRAVRIIEVLLLLRLSKIFHFDKGDKMFFCIFFLFVGT